MEQHTFFEDLTSCFARALTCFSFVTVSLSTRNERNTRMTLSERRLHDFDHQIKILLGPTCKSDAVKCEINDAEHTAASLCPSPFHRMSAPAPFPHRPPYLYRKQEQQ